MKILRVRYIEIPAGSHEGRVVYLASDHRGFKHKQELTKELGERGYNIIDIGTYSEARCDYPEISDKLGRKISENPFCSAGIGICGTGMGIVIPASKHRGVYAARCVTPEDAELARRHNNTNLLGIGADTLDVDTVLKIATKWLETPFGEDDERYTERYLQTLELEKKALLDNMKRLNTFMAFSGTSCEDTM